MSAVAAVVFVGTLIVSHDLVNPIAKVGHPGVHSRGIHVAVGGAPGDNANEVPCATVLAHQRTTRIPLKMTCEQFCFNILVNKCNRF